MRTALGIDTSNYTTSAAIVTESGEVLADERMLLSVKPGEKGLRQQEALFQHVTRLGDIIENAYKRLDEKGISRDTVSVVAVSERPRPVEGSYMPCFLAGVEAAQAASSARGIPLYGFSHQEGHIAAIADEDLREFLCYHLSGGTCELLNVGKTGAGYDIEIIGATRDISFGQLLDRIGVKMGYDFPAGGTLDELAVSGQSKKLMKPIRLDGLCFNVSGLETQTLRLLESGDPELKNEDVSAELFEKISMLLRELTEKAIAETGLDTVVFCGGVSQSNIIRNALADIRGNTIFGEPSSDNAVGTARLGARMLNG